MPPFDADCPRFPISVELPNSTYTELLCPQPYAAGHELTDGEAQALNVLLREKVKRRLASVAISPRAAITDLQHETDVFAYNYSFSTGERASSYDPVHTEAVRIAMDMVRARICANGGKVTKFSTAQIRAFAKKLILEEPKILSQAAEEVSRRDALAKEIIES